MAINPESDLYTLNKNLESERIARDVKSIRLSEDKKTIYYIKSDSLWQMTLGKEAERIAREIVTYNISKDGKTAYFINEDDELRYVRGGGDSVKIADDVDSFQIALDGTLYFLSDVNRRAGSGTFSTCKSEKDVKKIADDVADYSVGSDSQWYSVRLGNDEYDIYVAKMGKGFTQAIKEIDISSEKEREGSD